MRGPKNKQAASESEDDSKSSFKLNYTDRQHVAKVELVRKPRITKKNKTDSMQGTAEESDDDGKISIYCNQFLFSLKAESQNIFQVLLITSLFQCLNDN